MKTLTKGEFEKLYGADSTQAFSKPQQSSGGFDFEAAKNVFSKAGEDVSLARQTQTEQGNSLGSTIRTGATMAIQGGLSVPRAIGAGVMGTETAQNVTQKAVKGLGDLGEAITPDAVKKFVGEKAMKTIEGYNSMSPQEQLDIRNKLGTAEVLSYFLGGQAIKEAVINPVAGVADNIVTATTKQLPKSADDVFKQGKDLRQNIQSLVGEKSVEPQFKASAERAVTKPVSLETPKYFLGGTGKRGEDVVVKYDRYLNQSEQAINDIKVDPAISEVGSKMGDSFEGVIKQRQAVGKVIGDELKEWGKLRVSVKDSFDKIIQDLDGSGLSYNPKTRQLTSFQGNKFVSQEVDMLNNFVGRMRLLGDTPSVNDIDNFVSKMRTELDFAKGASGVMKTTNAERIINGGIASLKESLNPSKNGIQQLNKYWNANKTYSDLSDFVEEGVNYLGKKTQTGDFAKDASVAKSAVQSILNNGKKDWMIKLEALTGYNALDDAVIALQAMKDAGDFRGLSLLQAMKDDGIPMSQAGLMGTVVNYASSVGKRVVAGTPAEQTRAFLKSLKTASKKVDLKVPDKKIVAKAGIPKTKEIKAIEEKISKNVDSQKAAIKAKDFELVAKLKEVYNKLVKELKDLLADYKKNGIPLGLSIRKTVTPESVAKKADKMDIKFLAKVIDKVEEARTSPEANQILDNMGLGKADNEELVAFAKDVISAYEGVARQVVGKKVPLSTTLAQEAKKYKSAEEFANEIADRKYITDRTPKERTTLDMLVQKELYKTQTPQPVKISSLDFNERQTLKDYKPKPGAKINDPIIVEKGVVKDGHHRVAQAIANGDDTILAFEKIDYDTKKSQLTDIWNKAQGSADDLVSQAKKYKSAEEFVKAQGETVYHGTNQDFDSIDLSKSSRNMFGRGFSVTNDKQVAGYYGSKQKEFVLSPEAKIYQSNTAQIKEKDFTKASELYNEKYGKELQMNKYLKELNYKKDTPFSRVFWVSENPEVLKAKELWGEYIKSKGFDVVQERDTFNVLNTDVLKTRTQLTDIWNKANGKTP